jgi:hypothetical protein
MAVSLESHHLGLLNTDFDDNYGQLRDHVGVQAAVAWSSYCVSLSRR